MREARLLEQTNNPNYLKPTKKGNGTKESYADIPIAEIALDVPLQIHCKCWWLLEGIIYLNIIHFCLIYNSHETVRTIPNARPTDW